jgi:tRNA pseudouridine38-40 synthase
MGIVRYCAKLEYLGTNYFGWQRQPHSEPTIQTIVQNALSQVAHHPVSVICSGRTDRGVHAKGQIIHFDSSAERTIKNWVDGVNSLLPDDISVQFVHLVDKDFHARYSACERTYQYVILNQLQPSALFANRACHISQPLDIEVMKQASQCLIGTYDFSAFRASGCQAKSPIKTMKNIVIECQENIITFDFKANAYLYHMIRNICGALVAIGQHKHPPEWLSMILQNKNRCLAPPMLPACGLYLTQINYPDIFKIPQ